MHVAVRLHGEEPHKSWCTSMHVCKERCALNTDGVSLFFEGHRKQSCMTHSLVLLREHLPRRSGRRHRCSK